MAAAEKTEKKTSNRRDAGAYVVLNEQGGLHMVEGSQLRAALAGLAVKGSIVFWPFGKTLAEVLGENKTVPVTS